MQGIRKIRRYVSIITLTAMLTAIFLPAAYAAGKMYAENAGDENSTDITIDLLSDELADAIETAVENGSFYFGDISFADIGNNHEASGLYDAYLNEKETGIYELENFTFKSNKTISSTATTSNADNGIRLRIFTKTDGDNGTEQERVPGEEEIMFLIFHLI